MSMRNGGQEGEGGTARCGRARLGAKSVAGAHMPQMAVSIWQKKARCGRGGSGRASGGEQRGEWGSCRGQRPVSDRTVLAREGGGKGRAGRGGRARRGEARARPRAHATPRALPFHARACASVCVCAAGHTQVAQLSAPPPASSFTPGAISLDLNRRPAAPGTSNMTKEVRPRPMLAVSRSRV